MEAIIRFAMCAMMPRTGDMPGVADTGIDAFLRAFRKDSNFAIWSGVFIGSLIFMLTPLFTVFLPLPAFLLSERLLEKHARKLAGTSIYLVRQPIFLVKMAAGLCWGASAEVRARMNLPPYPADPGTWRTAA